MNYSLAYIGLSSCEKRPPHHLSSGEKKRVANAEILVMEPASLKTLLENKKIDFIGAMATTAKMMAGEEKIDLEFTYGVIDKCILKTLAGKSSSIVTSRGMVQHALPRIKSYGKEYDLETVLLTDK